MITCSFFRSICYLEWTLGRHEENSDSGTGFLMKTSRGFMFVSAGHNFREGENGLEKTELKRFNMVFNNPKGLSYKNKTKDTIHINLQIDLLDKFDYTLAICHNSEMLLKEKKNGKHVPLNLVEGRPNADFMVLSLYDTEAVKEFLQQRGLTWLECASKEYRKPKQNESVLTFGYPAIEEEGTFPLRLSFGKEGSPENVEKEESRLAGYPVNYRDENIVYDLDTEKGSSGSPVIGRGRDEDSYTVKAIHVARVSELPWNLGQIIH
jgi:hypothetical protein